MKKSGEKFRQISCGHTGNSPSLQYSRNAGIPTINQECIRGHSMYSRDLKTFKAQICRINADRVGSEESDRATTKP